MSDIALRVENLSKAYRIGLAEDQHDSFAQMVVAQLKAPKKNFRRLQRMGNLRKDLDHEDVIWALKDINLEVKTGEIVGVIGRNGAGKSTLLKVLSRITRPTTGRAVVHGRVGSLLEIGTGFHPDLSGRENLYLNGTILGMTKTEIDRKFDEIVAFAEIGRFIDTPIKRYSSGMSVRLAFSVAAHLEPEILLIDEVLAVGDLPFQRKCLGRIGEVANEGRTVLFVSHNIGAVEALCTRTIVLEGGRVVSDGDIRSGIEHYLEAVEGESDIDLSARRRSSTKLNPIMRRLRLRNQEGTPSTAVRIDDDFIFEVDLELGDLCFPAGTLSISIATRLNQVVTVLRNDHEHEIKLEGSMRLTCRLHNVRLAQGDYSVSLAIYDPQQLIDELPDITTLEVRPTKRHFRKQRLTGLWVSDATWTAS